MGRSTNRFHNTCTLKTGLTKSLSSLPASLLDGKKYKQISQHVHTQNWTHKELELIASFSVGWEEGLAGSSPTRRPICPACVCCTPPPPESCCCKCCASPIESLSTAGSP